MKEIISIDEVRKEVSNIQKTLNWLQSTSRLFPLNIPDYDEFQKKWSRLREGLKIDYEGNMLSQDKRGYWSVRK